MADKFPSTVNAFINFVAGEQPTAEKFNALVAQTKYGFAGLETAVGDIHSASWPYVADDTGTASTRLTMPFYRNIETGDEVTGAETQGRSLDIVSLARLIGPSSNLNPLVLDATHEVTAEVISLSNVTEFQLRYPVSGTISASNPTFANDTNGSLSSLKSNVKDVKADGDYHVDSSGTVHCFKAIASGLTATYSTDPTEYAGGANHPYARFNVIPDPNQVSSSSSEKVVVSTAGADGLHTVQLPLVTHQQTNYKGISSSLDPALDLNYQVQAKLPFVLTENMTIGQTIPAGFLYLKNVTTNEVYTEATYIYNDEDTFQVGNVDLADRISAGDTFQVLTVGTDITSAILDLQFKLFRHDHGRAHGEPSISVQSLVDNYKYKGDSGTFMPSTIDGNVFAQYLHRDGYRPDSENTVCNDANAMRGNLVFGQGSGTPGNFVVGDNSVTSRGTTFGLSFGGNCGEATPDSTYGPVIYGNAPGATYTNLRLKTEDNASAKVEVTGTGSFEANMSENIDLIAAKNITIDSTTADVVINTGDDFLVESADVIDMQAANSFKIRTTGAQADILLQVRGWDSGDAGYVSGIFMYDDDSSASTGYANTPVQMRFTNSDGVICRIDNATSSSGSTSTGCLELHHSGATASDLGSSTRQWIEFSASDRRVGRIQSRATSSSPSWAFYKVEPGNTSGSHNIYRDGDVSYISGNADFGEAVPIGDLTEWSEIDSVDEDGLLPLPEGMVVFVRRGKVWRSGPGTPMVVTRRAVVIGNYFDHDLEAHVILSFSGQVPVWVTGTVKDGDYLIPFGNNFCVGVSPEKVNFAQYRSAIGIAWVDGEPQSSDGHYQVLAAIGVK